jgi:hypothetical protein
MNEFKPEEGDRVLVGWVEDEVDNERIYLYTNSRGKFVCVYEGDEEAYKKNKTNYTVITTWPYIKPLLPPPKPKLPEFIDGDPIIVWDSGGRKGIRIVCDVIEDGSVGCYHSGAFESEPPHLTPIIWSNYKPLPNYNYGDRKVWGSEDDK